MTNLLVCGLEISMKTIIITCLVFLSPLALAADLSGLWEKTFSERVERPVHFILVDGFYRTSSQERFVFESGELSHTINQHVKITPAESELLSGTVDFYDSRGCSFTKLPVKVEFQNEDLVNILMTVPRYKYVTISSGPAGRRRYPVYCTDYYGRSYICSYEWRRLPPRSVRSECQVLEYVEVPVQLERIR